MKLIISAIVVGTLSATNVLGLDREAFNECYAVHKAESIWPSYSFHQCILKQDHSNYTITQNAVIKNCQRIRNSSLLFAEVSNKYYKLLDSISLEITKVNEFLISLHNYDERTPEDPLKFNANSSFTRELRKKIDLLSYYALIYYKNHKHVYGYRNEL
ncbi:hypothetical protein AX774_g945 [Zancudomyces culisetae]|uniref:Uncharacterized protein n=1 Tax=Zancudomyces culisetae TaxID=1213189 RepID=A0A1R1PX64_ZANCU|nr:hypothetical protein AX774_g945 [Zancudomyces culisetae]|eukprot:OMH85513.1 hypothetical protein AX774_g945 [Zancudomyces culisetae]